MADDPRRVHDEGPEPRLGHLPGWLTDTPYWAVSGVAHVILLLVIGSIVLLQANDLPKEVQTVIRIPSFAPPPYDPTAPRATETMPKTLDPEVDDNIVIPPTPEVATETPRGEDREQLTDRELDSSSINDVLSLGGGGASGRIGDRTGRDALRRYGTSEATEAAVLAALLWLRRHQHPDGHWSGAEYTHQCADPNKPCAMAEEGYSDGRGFADHDVGLTGLAMLAYLGYGQTHRDGERKEFRVVMKRAMDWMLKQQVTTDSDQNQIGRYGPAAAEEWMYSHAIATMAMGELLFLSRDTFKLQRSVEAATKFCMDSQNEGYGWKYKYKGGTNDTSVTGWMVLALKTSRACSAMRVISTDKEKFQQHFDWALAWFGRSTAKISGKTGYETPGDDGSRMLKGYPEPYPFSQDLSCMTAVAVLCRLFSGESPRSEDITKGIGILEKDPPVWAGQRGKRLSKINMYYWYYATYAMFQYGGPAWKDWNAKMQAALVPNQRQLGCEDGSWDPLCEWGLAGGRVYATAINAMTLEVYYRFKRVGGGD